MARPRIVVATLVYLGVSLVSVVLFGSNWLSYRRFAMEGRATVATVVETTCGNHATFAYEFAAMTRPTAQGAETAMETATVRT